MSGVCRTQVRNVMRYHEILDPFQDNGNSSRKRHCVSTTNIDMNDFLWQWSLKTGGQHIPSSQWLNDVEEGSCDRQSIKIG